MKRFFLLSALLLTVFSPAGAKSYSLTSPDGELRLTVKLSDTLAYCLAIAGKPVLKDCRIAMVLSDGTVLGDNAHVLKDSRGTRSETIESPFYRQKSFKTEFNYLTLNMQGEYAVQFRAYNDGVAYRFLTSMGSKKTVRDEIVQFSFARDFDLIVPYVRPSNDIYRSSFENQYTFHKVSDTEKRTFAFCPILARLPEGGNVLISESDVEDYPGMFLKRSADGFTAAFPPIPEATAMSANGREYPTTYTRDIAKVSGERTFPWRIAAYAKKDTDLPVNNMVYQTASPSRIPDVSWIKPGQSTWDWWNNFALKGVDFKSGVNTETYKFHIDFASSHNIPYVILDEGWYNAPDPFSITPSLDLDELFSYASEKGVRLVLWITCGIFRRDMEHICSHYCAKGAAGFKIDFFDAQHQDIVKTVYEMASTCARYHMVIDFHGIYKPTGLSRTYPNVLNYEGVFGLEQLKFAGNEGKVDMPLNDVILPYIRQAAGPMDYTQGATRNASKSEFRVVYSRAMSQGTRSHQVAQYIVFDSPFVMLCDSPSDYLEQKPMLSFINEIPAVFDSTAILSGKVAQNIVTLRRKGGTFYVGALTNWDARDIDLSFCFLGEGQWTVRLFRDGANADLAAEDYVLETFSVNNKSVRNIRVASGGGFAMIITKSE